MVGENFEMYLSQMAKTTLKLSTVVGENFEIYFSHVAKHAFKLANMVGEIFLNLLVSSRKKMQLIFHHGWRKF